jgi:GTP-binding protein
MKELEAKIYHKLWFMTYSPILTVSALSRSRITKVFPLIDKVTAEYSRRITTHELNLFLKDAVSAKAPPMMKGRHVRIYYIAQVSSGPPVFVLFTNRKTGIKKQYLKYLENLLRDRFNFEGVPILLYVRQR